MSGRKASEVNGLLSKGDQARKAGESNLLSNLNRTTENIKSNENNIDNIVKLVNSIEGNLTSNSYDEFAEEAELLSSKFQNIKKTVSKQTYSLSKINSRINKSNKKLAELDKESQDIRDRVRNNPHYCDNEYNRADQLIKEYKTIATERNYIYDELNKLNTKSNLDVSKYESSLSSMRNLEESIKSLNKKSKEILELRKEANKASEFIDSLFKDIDGNLANKFMKDSYEKLAGQKNEFSSMNDSDKVNKLNVVSQNISNFNHKLKEEYEKFKMEQASSNKLVNSIEDMIKNSIYYDPMDYARNGDKANQIDVVKFLNQFAKGAYVSELNDSIANIKGLIDAEKFDTANEESNKTIEILEKSMAFATLKQENLVKNTTLTLDIRNVMRKMNYEVSATKIDGDITNGFSITCKSGDEIIDFDKVMIDDEGKVIIDIDHTESLTGSCANKWDKIQAAFINEGILMQDVTKNGRSILNRQRSSTSKNTYERSISN